MLPTNSSNATTKGCVPTSTECVIWQGPDLTCINICRGDSISTVVYRIAVELCALMDMFDLTNYDLTCLELTVTQTPVNAGELLQLLVNRICALENVEPVENQGTLGCPSGCTVALADCFQYLDSTGTLVTTMDLMDYITAIGNRICDLVTDVATLENRVLALETGAAGQALELTLLSQTKASTSSLQYQTSTAIDPAGSTQYITESLRLVENALISTQDAVGTPTLLHSNIIKAGNITTEDVLDGTGTMSSLVGWTDTVSNSAESIGNMWLAVRDIRAAVDYLKINTIANDCSQINLNFRASVLVAGLVTTITVYTDGSLGFNSNWSECNNTTTILIADSAGNTTTTTVKLLDLITDPTGLQIDISATSIDPTLDITVTAKSCFYNSSSLVTCEKDYVDLITPGTQCPPVTITIFTTSINYQFTTISGYNYTATVFLRDSSTVIASQIIASPGISVNNLITGLASGVDYDLQIATVDSEGTSTECAKTQFSTIATVCLVADTALITQTIV